MIKMSKLVGEGATKKFQVDGYDDDDENLSPWAIKLLRDGGSYAE